MDMVTKLDSRRRGVFPPPFQPGDVLVRDSQDAEAITFRLVEPADVPVVRPIRKNGCTMLPRRAVSREMIALALRAERDAR